MVTCEEYRLLDDLLQAHLLRLDGVFLMGRSTPRVTVRLFALYSFYAEVFFDKKSDEPLYVKSFEFGLNLDMYLEVIVIQSLFETII